MRPHPGRCATRVLAVAHVHDLMQLCMARPAAHGPGVHQAAQAHASGRGQGKRLPVDANAACTHTAVVSEPLLLLLAPACLPSWRTSCLVLSRSGARHRSPALPQSLAHGQDERGHTLHAFHRDITMPAWHSMQPGCPCQTLASRTSPPPRHPIGGSVVCPCATPPACTGPGDCCCCHSPPGANPTAPTHPLTLMCCLGQ